MLRAMALVDQFRKILSELPPDWPSAELALAVAEPAKAAQAAALLGPLNPGRSGATIRFACARTGTDNIARLLSKLDRERIEGSLELEATTVPIPAAELEGSSLAEAWAEEARRSPRRLERPLRRGRVHLERPPGPRGSAACAAQSVA